MRSYRAMVRMLGLGMALVMIALPAHDAEAKRKKKNYMPKDPQFALLVEAVMQGNLKQVKQLHAAGVDIQSTFSKTKGSILHTAAYNGHVPIAKYLIAQSMDVNAKTTEDVTPLYAAVRNQQIPMVKYLLKVGADVEIADDQGDAPLTIAIINKFSTIASILLSSGAESNRMVQYDKKTQVTLLILAASQKNLPIVRALLKYGAKIDAVDTDKSSALMWATHRGDVKIVQLLLKKGANPFLKNKFDSTAINYANDKPAILKLLKKAMQG